jgi:hypothetical protein
LRDENPSRDRVQKGPAHAIVEERLALYLKKSLKLTVKNNNKYNLLSYYNKLETMTNPLIIKQP